MPQSPRLLARAASALGMRPVLVDFVLVRVPVTSAQMASRPANRLSKLISSLQKKLPSALHQPAQTLAFNSQVPRARGRHVAACARVQGPGVISTRSIASAGQVCGHQRHLDRKNGQR
jgi:hypothetical protein